MKWALRIIGVVLLALGLAFVVFRTPDTGHDEMRAKYGGEPSQFVTLSGGQQFHVRDEGPRDGYPIILIHGANSSLHTWDAWTDDLAKDYRVLRFDQVGHGLTGPPRDANFTKARYVSDVDALADHFGLEQFVLAGNSMGGWVSTAYAIEHPERVRALALLNASGAPRKEGEGRLYLGGIIASTPVLNQVMTQITPRGLVKSSLEGSVADPSQITEEQVDRYWELLRYPGNRQAVVDRANTSRGGPFDPSEIERLNMPVLIIWGEQDQVTPMSGARWYDEHLPGSTLVTYPDVAHLPMEEIPERSGNDLRDWLERILLEEDVSSD